MVICLERGADLHMAQLTPLPLTVSCFDKILIGFTFLVPAHLGSSGKRAFLNAHARVRACVCWNKYCAYATYWFGFHIVTGRQERQVHMCCFLNCATAEAET